MDQDDTLPQNPLAEGNSASAADERTDDNSGAADSPTHLNDPTSRRRFLRTAVIGAAGVAGAVGAAGVALGHAQLPGVLALNTTPTVSFHDPGCSMCVTDSGFSQIVGNTDATGFKIQSGGGAAGPGDFYIWFTAPSLPAGTYTITFTPDPAFTVQPPTGGNPYFRNIYKGGTNYKCPTAGNPTSSPHNAVQLNKSSLSQLFPVTLPQNPPTGGAPQDLQLQVHMSYTGGVIGVVGTHKHFTFSATITKSGQATAVCTESVTIEGTQH